MNFEDRSPKFTSSEKSEKINIKKYITEQSHRDLWDKNKRPNFSIRDPEMGERVWGRKIFE